MSFKIMFWNIENYAGSPERTEKVVGHIRDSNPDVVGFSEIKDKVALRSILQAHLTDYDFGVTDGREGIELLAGWKRALFQQAIFTQRREFKADNPFLRPGSLLSVKHNEVFYNILFLHTDSGTKKKDYDNRQEMFEKIWALKAKLDEITDDAAGARFMALGDLNTMGRQRSGSNPRISGETEITELADDASDNGMALQAKSHPDTWARVDQNGLLVMTSNLDHVLATTNLHLQDLGSDVTVTVRGWVDANSDQERKFFVEDISDHCSIECQVVT